MFHPLVIWTLFHVHHQKDIKQDAEFKIRSQGLGKKYGVCECVLTACSLYIAVRAFEVYTFFMNYLKPISKVTIIKSLF